MIFCISALILLGLSYILAKKNKKYQKYLIIINTMIALNYIIWRFTTISFSSVISFILGILLIAAELIGLCQFFTFQFLFLRKYNRKEKSWDCYKDQDLPVVDVLICTYNESPSLLKKTLVAALNMHYPADKLNVYVCDDGNRKEIGSLCREYGCHWITRQDTKGAKAGNINHALSKTTGDLFLVLDADMIPKKEFLIKTLGYFADEDVAFVQTPQVFYNMDMYQYNYRSDIPNEQDFFMRDVQEARAAINAVLHVGTNALFRKKYVEEIGGYPTCSITEDMGVGLLLHAKQYKGVFVNEELAYGISAQTYTDLLKQRDRWCRGNLQIMYKLWPKASKGLSMAQRLAYFDGLLYWFSSIQKMIYLMMPILFLIFAIPIIHASVYDLIMLFIPFIIGQLLIFKALSPKTRSIRWSHIYDTAMAPHLTVSILKQLFKLKIAFHVTPKETEYKKGYFQLRIVLPHIILAVLSLVSWYTGYLYLENGIITLPSYLINMMWSVFNLFALIICIYVAYQKPITHKPEQISLDAPVDVAIKTTANGAARKFPLHYYADNKAGIAHYGRCPFSIHQQIWFSYDGINYLKARISKTNSRYIELLFAELDNKEFHIYMNHYAEYLQTPYKFEQA